MHKCNINLTPLAIKKLKCYFLSINLKYLNNIDGRTTIRKGCLIKLQQNATNVALKRVSWQVHKNFSSEKDVKGLNGVLEVISKMSYGLPPWRDWCLVLNPQNTDVFLGLTLGPGAIFIRLWRIEPTLQRRAKILFLRWLLTSGGPAG